MGQLVLGLGASGSVYCYFASFRYFLRDYFYFLKEKLFGYPAMVAAMAVISLLSFLVWVHHFFTMGSGALVNSFFSITTMMIAIPTGIKIFNWLFTMYKGRITFTTPMLWSLAFILTLLLVG